MVQSRLLVPPAAPSRLLFHKCALGHRRERLNLKEGILLPLPGQLQSLAGGFGLQDCSSTYGLHFRLEGQTSLALLHADDAFSHRQRASGAHGLLERSSFRSQSYLSKAAVLRIALVQAFCKSSM